MRAVGREDLLRLLEIKMQRIAKFSKDKNEELIAKIRAEIARIEKDLSEMTRVTVEWFEMLKEKYGKDITIMGHVMPGFIYSATEEEIREERRKENDAYKNGGGFVLASGCEYPAALDFHMAKVMVEEARTYGKYEK